MTTLYQATIGPSAFYQGDDDIFGGSQVLDYTLEPTEEPYFFRLRSGNFTLQGPDGLVHQTWEPGVWESDTEEVYYEGRTRAVMAAYGEVWGGLHRVVSGMLLP